MKDKPAIERQRELQQQQERRQEARKQRAHAQARGEARGALPGLCLPGGTGLCELHHRHRAAGDRLGGGDLRPAVSIGP